MRLLCRCRSASELRAGVGRLLSAAPLILVLGILPCTRAPANCGACEECGVTREEDTLVCNCFDGDPGEVGCDALLADVGQSVAVAVSVATTSEIDAFSVDLEFPSELVRYDSSSAGDLTQDFDFFDTSLSPQTSTVRMGGFEVGDDAIVSGMIGGLAILHFTVLAPGCDAFCLVNLRDDLELYSVCQRAMTATSGTDSRASWGRVKLLYR
jgi:hypothetical protein